MRVETFVNFVAKIGYSCHFSRINCEFWLYLYHRFPDPPVLKRLQTCLRFRIENKLSFNLLPCFSVSEFHHLKNMMGFQNLRLPFVIFMIMLMMISQQSYCRQLHIKNSEGEKQTEKTESTSQSQHFSPEAPERSRRDEIDPVVNNGSLRVVPAGPNPLHN